MARITPIPVRLRDGRAVTLRAAEAGDVDALVLLNISVAKEQAYTLSEPAEAALSGPRIAKRVAKAVNNPHELRLLAIADSGGFPPDAGHVVGDLSMSAHQWKRLAHCATLGIDIHHDYRRVGLGDAMVRAALNWAAAHPAIERVELYCYADNAPAIALYKKHGFVEEGRRVRFFKLAEGRYADDLVMATFVKGCGRTLPGH